MYTIIKIALILLLAPVLGCFLAGLDRKLTAKLQGRVGPPLLQPFYDVRKLFSKENIAVSRFQNVYVLIYFTFVVLSLLMFFFESDLLMIIFIFTIANVAFIVGSSSSGSPFSKIGSQREIIAMLCYEPVLIFFIVGMYMLTGSFKISSLANVTAPLIIYLPFIFVAMLFIMIIKFKKSPFDFSTSHHAHQEIVKGITTEYSGPALGIIEVTHWYESVFLLSTMMVFWKANIVIGILLALGTFIFIIVMDNICARLTWQWMLKITWGVVIVLCTINIIALYYLNIKLI